ncbi:sulfotransferase family protein [Nocardioides kribbensis]|uniref:Sulfotransferase n=1 Tax=Nocardioides kribbensis TaxID=305517 RepID=A0ABV1P1Y5_9ACTN
MRARPVFVLGTGRCGSTLVHEVLARHEDTGFVTNLDDLGVLRSRRVHNVAWRRLPAGVTRKGGARFAPSEAYRLLAREVSPLLVDPARDLTAADATPWLRRRLVDLVEDRAETLGAPVFLHKLTGWPRAGLLLECFPDALVVEVVRDGRAVASSWLQMPWWDGHRGAGGLLFGPLRPDLHELWREHGESFPVLAGLAWRALMEAYDDARALAPAGSWIRVRHEDVVADPRGTLGAVLDHVGLARSRPFERGLARHHFDPARSEAFRDDLATGDVAALDKVLDAQLLALGYR